jgi:hypothetical protein
VSTFIVHETQKITAGGKVRYAGRLYCKCGASMAVSTNNVAPYEAALNAFIDHHQGEECGDTDPVTCRRNRNRREREAVSAQDRR